MKDRLITIQNLNYYFNENALDKQVLFDINLKVNLGEIIILTGPSGSGKTTLLSLIGGLRSVREGSLRVFNQELYQANETKLIQIRRQIGYIFQNHNLLPFMTACQNVQMAVELQPNISPNQARSRSQKILQAVGLGNRINYYPCALSGGQKQRVAIARALVNRPQLIVADEPTASLDSKTGRQVINLMQKLAKEQGCSIFLVTHDPRILDIADRLIEIEDGRLNN
ncbi:ABC exporter ATP-binding subunit, DevA family (plasmid) [Stanieria sp. NIES-3757]|nr:ABC exporter ATP-binding subunit, DevA family [Stanieria sp. NIES-3757]